MALPGNGIFVVRGEISTLITAFRRGNRWNPSNYQEEDHDGLMKQLIDLKALLNTSIEDIRLIDPNIFLGPFLDVIRSEETTGQITSLALSALNKFLSYGLIDPTHSTLAATVENIADAVTHARFVGSDQASDGVVLMKIVQVLRTLMLSPEGSALTNESVCEVMLSCFRICFEPRLNELLRRTAEHALKDMILLLFMRLPQFAEERHASGLIKKLKMMASGSGSIEHTHKRRKFGKNSSKTLAKTVSNTTRPLPVTKCENEFDDDGTEGDPGAKDTAAATATTAPDTLAVNQQRQQPSTPNQLLVAPKQSALATTPLTPLVGNIVDMQGRFMQTPNNGQIIIEASTPTTSASVCTSNDVASEHIKCDANDEKQKLLADREDSRDNDADVEEDPEDSAKTALESVVEAPQLTVTDATDSNVVPETVAKDVNPKIALIPYGLPCIRELLRFLISLCNPMDKQNTDAMIHMGLSLLTIALEVGADSIGKYDALLEMVKDDLCRNVFALLNTERLTIFAADLQVCFLLFESQRICLKFHLENYLNKLAEIIGSENPRIPYEMRELALDNLLQFLRIPAFSVELYINYDCNLYCTNVLEDLVKLLSKNSLSATQQIYTIHQISLDGLLTIVADIERNSLHNKSVAGNNAAPSIGRHSYSNSNVDANASEYQTDLNATTSGGEESSAMENIQNIIKSDTKTTAPHTDHKDNRRTIQTITHDQLIDIKNKKRILTQGTELFNRRPEKGIQFLQENDYLNSPLDPSQLAHFLRDNPGLDKKQIGEYISKKKNVDAGILEMFVKSFDFTGMRIDVALRQYLETFRLPGEAPLIFLVLEHFADHWHKLNNEPFANTDAAFRLAYAIIMLNMDQHNHNAKRLNIPMTLEDFQKNLRGLNGNLDFDQEMLMGVYTAIKNEEIIMPAEQTGLVRENYLWKMLLRRNQSKDGHYLNAECSSLDKDIFQLVWGPTLVALSFIFDRSTDTTYHKSLIAFTKGAAIAAHFQLLTDFNALILTLCKFTTLLNSGTDGTSMVMSGAPANVINHEITASVQFGLNMKAQLAMKCVFAIVHKHGDCLRSDGWKNCIEVILQLFKLRLLPKRLMEADDFCEPSGRVRLVLEKPMEKQDIGLFSSLYSYLSSDGQRQPTYEEQEIIKNAKRCVRECQLEQICDESPFLHMDALRELIRCLLSSLKPPVAHKSDTITYYAEDTTVFLLEFLVEILIKNRDRVLPLWNDCRDQIYLILLGSSCYEYNYLLVRTTVALLKLAIDLMRNEELCPIVLQSLKMLLMLKPNIILKISKQISTGIYELLKKSAQNIHTESDWDIIFTLLECVGAGAIPPDFEDSLALNQAFRGAQSDGALSTGGGDTGDLVSPRGYISDSEIPHRGGIDVASSARSNNATPAVSENWIIVNKDSEVGTTMASRPESPIHTLVYPCKLIGHSSLALVRCYDSLAFIVHNVAHITPYNFESCVKCIRTFVEASLNGGNVASKTPAYQKSHDRHSKASHMRPSSQSAHTKSSSAVDAQQNRAKAVADTANYLVDSDGEGEDAELLQRYETIAIQLLDLMHMLHTRTAQIFRWWAEEGGALPQCSALWALGWCPILQGIARLSTDQRRIVRTSAITCLQRALLMHDLQTLTGPEWESCFKQVLFPLLYDLLVEVPTQFVGSDLLEESRNRTAYIMSKVFLYRLTSLISITTFSELWLEILEYIEKFMHLGSDMLHEAMLECLKNMLLVMHSDQFRVFHNADGETLSPLWDLTWNRIAQFLPNLKQELFDKEPVQISRPVNKITHDPLIEIKNKKHILIQGSELFNRRPDEGIQFLQENGYLNLPLDPSQLAHFLRNNPGLDKKQIGEFISEKKNVDVGILEMFVRSFDFTGMRIDVALRQYLETFRLPGEAPLVFLVLQRFAEHWHKLNNEPFANTDAAFRLAYATIMLNMDQHNHNAKRSTMPMTFEDFQRNLRGSNGSLDFDPELLMGIYTAIKNEEISMPADQTDMVRENPLWNNITPPSTAEPQIVESSPQERNANATLLSHPSHVLPSSNLLLTGATPLLPEVSTLPLTAPTLVPIPTTDQTSTHTNSADLYDTAPWRRPTIPDAEPLEVEIVPSTNSIPISSSSATAYVQNGPYINPNFSKIINLPVTPSPPPLLELDENVENSSDKANASPAKQLQPETSELPIPLSHQRIQNQYPSLNRIPPVHIAQSFTPMYLTQQQQQQQQQQHTHQHLSEKEIYSDYVNDPYNLTLQVEQNFSIESSEKSETTAAMATPIMPTMPTVSQSNMNVFQSLNYFGSPCDGQAIPPGSEMLFGGP